MEYKETRAAGKGFMAERVIEGTWEEIAEQGEQLSGKRVRLTVLDEIDPENGNTTMTEANSTTEVLAALSGVIDSRATSLPRRASVAPMVSWSLRNFESKG